MSFGSSWLFSPLLFFFARPLSLFFPSPRGKGVFTTIRSLRDLLFFLSSQDTPCFAKLSLSLRDPGRFV